MGQEKLGRIYDLVSNKSLTKHQLILNIYKLNNSEIPELPPLICSCKITLKNGQTFNAILELKKPPFFYKDDDDEDEYFWKALSKNPLKRHYFNLSDVTNWEFI